jgi:AraC family transcriptional regulator, exoenzyme S synthesis regulatory protein ExsA
MKVFNLPADIYKNENAALDNIIVHEFRSTTDTVKERSVMSKNAVSLVIKGHKTMYFAEHTVNANDKEIHFLSAGNCIASIEFLTQDEFHSILIFFDDHILADFFVKNNDIIQKYRAKGSINHKPYIALQKDAFITHYIASLRLILDSGATFSKEMKALKFEELMQYLVEQYPESILSFQYTQKKTGLDIEIRQVVETNIGNNLSVDELAFLCNLSPSTFKRYFQKIYNTSPSNWFLQQRMKTAAQLLSHSKEKPVEIFYKVGYENHSSFSKSFKKFYGVSPKEFQISNKTF